MTTQSHLTFRKSFTHSREKRRRIVVHAVYFIYFLSLVEGPLRKWFLPELAGPLTVLRDPFAIALYVYAFANGFMLRRGLAALWLGFAVFTSWFGLLQYMVSGYGFTGWVLGVRSYWLYLPLAFVVASSFRYNDVMRFFRLNLWIALPYAALVVMQYNSGASAFLNRGVGGDEEGAVGLVGSIVRPFGLFTFTSPNVQFTAAMIAMFVALYLAGRRHWPVTPVFVAMGLAVAGMGVLTGSRVIYFQVVIILLVTILGLFLMKPSLRNLRRIFGVFLFVVLAGAMFVRIFPDMLDAMEARIQVANASEGSIWNRIYYSTFSFIDAYYTTTIIGHGIGAGAPGVAKFIGLSQFIFGEADTQRNVNELGLVLGVVFLFMRWGTALFLFFLALRMARSGFIVSLPLFGFFVMPLAIAQLTNSPIIAFLPWLEIGFFLALEKHVQSEHGPEGNSLTDEAG